MICTRCGSPEDEDAVYCSGCGSLLAPPVPSGSETIRPAPMATGGAGTFMSSLFDINFRSFVTPKVIKVVYVLVMIVLGLSAIGYAIFALRVNAVFGILSVVVLCPLYFFITLALWRIVLEIFVVVFRIAEDIHAMRVLGDVRAAAAGISESGSERRGYRPAGGRAEDS
jgi:Domain of unknown function (DUF4282)